MLLFHLSTPAIGDGLLHPNPLTKQPRTVRLIVEVAAEANRQIPLISVSEVSYSSLKGVPFEIGPTPTFNLNLNLDTEHGDNAVMHRNLTAMVVVSLSVRPPIYPAKFNIAGSHHSAHNEALAHPPTQLKD